MRALVAGLAVLGLVVGLATSAAASDVAVSAGVGAGSLTLATAEGPAAVAVRGRGADLVALDLRPATIVDARGSGGGWTLWATASPVIGRGGAPLDDRALAIASVRVNTLTGRAPANDTAYPVVLPASAGTPSSPILSAAPGSGMGTFVVTPRVTLRVPPGLEGESYSGTVVLSLVAGP